MCIRFTENQKVATPRQSPVPPPKTIVYEKYLSSFYYAATS